MRVDRPTPVGSKRIEQKRDPLAHGAMATVSCSDQRDNDKARQRDRFEKPTALRLNRFENPQTPWGRRVAYLTRQRIARWSLSMPNQSDRDQGWQGITDDRQLHRREPTARKRSQFKG